MTAAEQSAAAFDWLESRQMNQRRLQNRLQRLVIGKDQVRSTKDG
jgi:hypothetical protein